MTKQTLHTDRYIIIATKIIAILVLTVLLIWGALFTWNILHYEQTNDAQVEEYINPITTRVSGYIRKINFHENQQVNGGDTLIIIDNDEFVNQQAESEAALESARAQVAILNSRKISLNSDADISISQIAAAKSRLVRQEKEYQRFKNLLAEQSTTQQQFDNVKTALDIATADYQTISNTHNAALAKIDEIKSQSEAAAAEIKRREAQFEQSKLNVNYTVIKAPYKGRIGKKSIQEGQFVESGQPLAFIINNNAGKWIIANYKETQTGDFNIGKPAEITIDAYPDRIFHGEIESVSPATVPDFRCFHQIIQPATLSKSYNEFQ